MTIAMPQPVPPTLAVIVSALPEMQALRVIEQLTDYEEVETVNGKTVKVWRVSGERLAAELTLAGFPVGETTVKAYRRAFTFAKEMTA